MGDIVGQIIRPVTGRSTRTNRTIYDIAFSDGNTYTTFDGDLAQKANGLIGQQVSARVEIAPSKDGRFTNYNIHDVAPAGQLAPSAMPVAGGTPIQVQAPAAQAAPIQMNVGDPEKDAKIAKAVSIKVAGPIVASLFQGAGPETLSEALETLEKASKAVYGLLTGGSQGASEQQEVVVPAAATPEAVVAAVNDAAGQEVVQQGALAGTVIPWQ